MYDPALSAFYAWNSCSGMMCEPDSTCLVLWTRSPPKTDIRPPFSLFAPVYLLPFGLFKISPKGILRSALGGFESICVSKRLE
jgi:hypothetical protein